jgi:hypothetical protein
LGAEKIFLKDTKISDKDSSNNLEFGNEEIDYAAVVITGSDDNSTFKIDTIEINVTADDDIYVPAGGKLSALMDEPQALLNSWDVEYAGLAPVSTEDIRIKTSGTNQYELQFVDGAGNDASIPLIYTSSGTNVKLGDNNDNLILHEALNITKNDYFILSDYSQKQGERVSYALRYTGASKSSASSPTIKFKNVGSGSSIERVYSAQPGAAGTGAADANIKIGGATYNVWNATLDTNSNFEIRVDLDGDGTLLTNAQLSPTTNMNITTKAGAVISFRGENGLLVNDSMGDDVTGGNLIVSIQTVDSDDYDGVPPSAIEFNVTAASAEVALAEVVTVSNLKYTSPSDETNVYYTYTSMGTKVKWDNPTSAPDTLDIEYPTAQRLPQVFITTPGVSISKGETTKEGSIVYYETTPIAVGTAMLASELEKAGGVSSKNSIIVGGPCANTAASEVMGNPADCTEGFEEGKAMLKLFEHANGNVALLVAGFSALDTRRASRVLANYETWQEAGKLKGTEVEVAGTSFTDITVSAPAPKVVEPVVEEEGNSTTTDEESA